MARVADALDSPGDGRRPLPDDVDVLVVGAGPTGLTAAVALAGQDAGVLVVEEREGPCRLPLSRMLDVRSMEVLRRLGVADDIVESALRLHRSGAPFVFASDVAHARPRPTMVQGWFGSTRHSPVGGLVCPQDAVERVLRRHLPVGGLRCGVSLVGFEQDADGVDAMLAVDGAGRVPIRARYVIGADGARSRVRESVGSVVVGDGAAAWLVAALVQADLGPLVGDRVCNAYFLDPPAGPQAILHPTLEPDRWVINLVYPTESRMTEVMHSDRRCVGDVRLSSVVMCRDCGWSSGARAECIPASRIVWSTVGCCWREMRRTCSPR